MLRDKIQNLRNQALAQQQARLLNLLSQPAASPLAGAVRGARLRGLQSRLVSAKELLDQKSQELDNVLSRAPQGPGGSALQNAYDITSQGADGVTVLDVQRSQAQAKQGVKSGASSQSSPWHQTQGVKR